MEKKTFELESSKSDMKKCLWRIRFVTFAHNVNDTLRIYAIMFHFAGSEQESLPEDECKEHLFNCSDETLKSSLRCS